MTPDWSKMFITCQNTDEVKVYDFATRSIRTFQVGRMPQEMAVSRKFPYVFVSCMEHRRDNEGKVRGYVYVIDYKVWDVKRIEERFFQPHGITVDDRNGLLYVFSRNIDTDGPVPHCTFDCNGRNGFYQAFDMNNNFKPVGIRHEVTPDPYGCDVRFKN